VNNPPSYFDYVREAFNASPRLPGLGNLPLNWMGLAGFATLGLLNPGFLLIGAAVEIAFLATLSNNARFQNYVRGKAIADDTSQRLTVEEEAVAARLVQLDDEDQKRYESLIQRIRVRERAPMASSHRWLTKDSRHSARPSWTYCSHQRGLLQQRIWRAGVLYRASWMLKFVQSKRSEQRGTLVSAVLDKEHWTFYASASPT
jgi:hypothetical protein